jgi:CheY-like chemotaxis protein
MTTTLPVPVADPSHATPAVARPVLLLVDDIDDEAKLLGVALKDAGLDVDLRHVVSGWDALRYVERRGAFADAPAPDLVLVDLDMPAMPGHELILHLRRGPSRIEAPVLVFTNSARVSDIRDCRRLGADHFLTKPFGYDGYINLVATLRNWLAPQRDLAGLRALDGVL